MVHPVKNRRCLMMCFIQLALTVSITLLSQSTFATAVDDEPASGTISQDISENETLTLLTITPTNPKAIQLLPSGYQSPWIPMFSSISHLPSEMKISTTLSPKLTSEESQLHPFKIPKENKMQKGQNVFSNDRMTYNISGVTNVKLKLDKEDFKEVSENTNADDHTQSPNDDNYKDATGRSSTEEEEEDDHVVAKMDLDSEETPNNVKISSKTENDFRKPENEYRIEFRRNYRYLLPTHLMQEEHEDSATSAIQRGQHDGNYFNSALTARDSIEHKLPLATMETGTTSNIPTSRHSQVTSEEHNFYKPGQTENTIRENYENGAPRSFTHGHFISLHEGASPRNFQGEAFTGFQPNNFHTQNTFMAPPDKNINGESFTGSHATESADGPAEFSSESYEKSFIQGDTMDIGGQSTGPRFPSEAPSPSGNFYPQQSTEASPSLSFISTLNPINKHSRQNYLHDTFQRTENHNREFFDSPTNQQHIREPYRTLVVGSHIVAPVTEAQSGEMSQQMMHVNKPEENIGFTESRAKETFNNFPSEHHHSGQINFPPISSGSFPTTTFNELNHASAPMESTTGRNHEEAPQQNGHRIVSQESFQHFPAHSFVRQQPPKQQSTVDAIKSETFDSAVNFYNGDESTHWPRPAFATFRFLTEPPLSHMSVNKDINNLKELSYGDIPTGKPFGQSFDEINAASAIGSIYLNRLLQENRENYAQHPDIKDLSSGTLREHTGQSSTTKPTETQYRNTHHSDMSDDRKNERNHKTMYNNQMSPVTSTAVTYMHPHLPDESGSTTISYQSVNNAVRPEDGYKRKVYDGVAIVRPIQHTYGGDLPKSFVTQVFRDPPGSKNNVMASLRVHNDQNNYNTMSTSNVNTRQHSHNDNGHYNYRQPGEITSGRSSNNVNYISNVDNPMPCHKSGSNYANREISGIRIDLGPSTQDNNNFYNTNHSPFNRMVFNDPLNRRKEAFPEARTKRISYNSVAPIYRLPQPYGQFVPGTIYSRAFKSNTF